MLPEDQFQPIAKYRERRKHARFNKGTMNIWIRRRGLLREFIRGIPAEWYNFNQYGMAFGSTTRLEIHEEVLIDIKVGNIGVSDLVAVIHNARRQAGKYRYGVQFYFGANTHMQSIETQELLAAIEHQLE